MEGIPIDYNESFVTKAEDHLSIKYNSDQGTELLFIQYFESQCVNRFHSNRIVSICSD